MPQAPMTSRGVRGAGGRGFTIIELGLVIIIIALLSSILLVAVRGAILRSRVAGEKQVCVSLRMACEQFKQQFGFLPPLILDSQPLVTTGDAREQNQPNVDPPGNTLDATFQANEPTPNFNGFYSSNSLPIYLVGAAEAVVDGVAGPGLTAPTGSGTNPVSGWFSRKGKTYEPLFDVTQDRKRLTSNTSNPAAPQYAIVDRWGRPLRYYRWQPSYYTAGSGVDRSLVGTIRKSGSDVLYNVPDVVLWSLRAEAITKTVNDFPELRSGGFAIVSAGADGKFSDDVNPADPKFDVDNIVEVGQ